MRRHGVLRNGERFGDIPCRKPLRFMFRQQAKHIEPRRLGERRKGENGVFRFHISRLMDVWTSVKQIILPLQATLIFP